MSGTSNRTIVFVFGTLLLLATILFAWYQQVYFLAVPCALMVGIFLVQYPVYLFYLLLLSIPWSIEYNFTPSLGTDLPDEPLMLLAAFAAIVLLVFRKEEWSRKDFLHPLLLIIILQFVWTSFTVIGSTDKLLSVKYLLAKGWYLLSLIVLPLFLFQDKKLIRRAGLLLMASMLLFMFYAIIQHYRYNFTFDTINKAVEPFYRNHVNYSALLVFTVPLQIAAIQLSRTRNTKLLLIAVLVVCCGALYFSYARGAWLAFIVGMAGYWLIRKKLLFFSFFVFVFVCIAAILYLKSNERYLAFSNDFKTTIMHENFSEHFAATYQLKDASTAERFYRWVAGMRMVNESWRTGFGPSTFYKEYKSYTQPAFKTWVSRNEERSTVHNYFLLLIIEQGAVGLILFLVLLAAVFWYAQKIYHRTDDRFWKISSAAVASILLMECAVNFLSDMIETDKAGTVFYLCVVTLIIADIKTRGQKKIA